jgi:hypothetical protein
LDQGSRIKDQGRDQGEDQGIAPGSVAPVAAELVLVSPQKKPRQQQSASADTWEAYAKAYASRYGTPPVRNARVNGQIANFVSRVGAEEAPHIAAWYVLSNAAWYVRQAHDTGSLAKDAEKLRTEWATRRQVTSTAALQADRTQTNFDAFAPLLEEARARSQEA